MAMGTCCPGPSPPAHNNRIQIVTSECVQSCQIRAKEDTLRKKYKLCKGEGLRSTRWPHIGSKDSSVGCLNSKAR